MKPLVRPSFRPWRPPPERPVTTVDGLLLFQSSTSTSHSTALLVGFCALAAALVGYEYLAWQDGVGPSWSLPHLLAYLFPGYFLFRFIRERQRLAQPQLQLLQTSSEAALGQVLQLRWQWTGAPKCERRLRVLLEGQQSLMIHDSDGASETRLPFAEWLICDSVEIEGSAEWLISPDTMHSFQGEKTRVLWTLLVDVEMEQGPDWAKRVPFEIRARPSSAGGDSIRRPILEPHGPLVPPPETAAGLGGYLGDVLT